MFIWGFVFILILVALNGFFTSVEFAAIASRRARITLLAEEGNHSAAIVKSWLDNPAARDRLIAASQLGITLVSLALGAVGENTFKELLTPLFQHQSLPPYLQRLTPFLAITPLLLSLLIVTSLHVVFGEQVPKVAALHNPEGTALFVARPMQAYSKVFKWFIDVLDWVTRHVLALIGLRMVGEHLTVYTVEEIKQILDESKESGIIQTPEREMLDAIFDLGELVVRQVMIPRTEIIAIEADATLEEIIQITSQSTYTKFPVYEDNLDQIVGILHIRDVFRAMQSAEMKDQTARTLAREPIFVPETISVNALLQQFRLSRQHIAIVLDEFGGTAGLVTLEDLLEEIIGEVSDQFDTLTPDIQTLADGSVLIDGLTLIEDVNQQLGLNLHDPDYDTIAGYVLGKLKRIPHPGDVVEGDGVRLRVESMDGMRIARLSLRRIAENSS